MADSTKNLDLVVSAKTQTGALARVGRNLDDLNKKASSGLLESLKGGFGRSSTFGQVEKILGGGGALIGLSLAGRQLNELAGKAQDLSKAFGDGSKTGGEIASELARSIPILGSIVEAGQKFGGMLYGDSDVIECMNAEGKRTNELFDFQIGRLKESHKEHEAILQTVRDIKRETALVGMVGPGRELRSINQGQDKSREDLAKQIEDKKAEIEEKYKKDLTEARAAADAANSGYAKAKIDAYKQDPNDPKFREYLSHADPETLNLIGDAENKTKQVKTITDQRNAEVEAATKDLNDKLDALDEQAAAKKREIRKQAARQFEDDTRATAGRIAAVESETQEESLRRAGKFHEADLEKIKEHDREARAEIANAAEQRARKDPGVLGSNLPRIALQEAQVAHRPDQEDQSGHRQGRGGRRQPADRRGPAREASRRGGDRRTGGRRGKVPCPPGQAPADRPEVRRGGSEPEARPAVPFRSRAAQIDKEIKSLPSKQAAELAAADKEHTKQVKQDLDSAREASLRQQAESGNHAADIELKRLEILKSYKDQAEKLHNILKDPTATFAQRAAATSDLIALQSSTSGAMHRAGLSNSDPRFASLTDGTHLSGAAAAAREKTVSSADDARAKLVSNTQTIATTLLTVVTALGDLLTAAQAGPQVYDPN